MKLTLHENQHFRKNVQRKYHMFLFFCNWRKYHIFRKTKSKENIISDIFRKKSIEQGVDKKKNWWNNKILYHADESYRIALTIIILLYILLVSACYQLKTAINNFGRPYAILDDCIQLLVVAYKYRNLYINLENYLTFQRLSKVVFFIPLILRFCYSYEMDKRT